MNHASLMRVLQRLRDQQGVFEAAVKSGVRDDIAADLSVAFACGIAIDSWRDAGAKKEAGKGKVSVQPAWKAGCCSVFRGLQKAN